jgi:precorrin-6B methylase 2
MQIRAAPDSSLARRDDSPAVPDPRLLLRSVWAMRVLGFNPASLVLVLGSGAGALGQAVAIAHGEISVTSVEAAQRSWTRL